MAITKCDFETVAAIVIYGVGSCVMEEFKKTNVGITDNFISRCFLGFYILTSYFNENFRIP